MRFARVDEKRKLWEILRKFSKIFLQKIAKNALFLQIFQKNLTNHALNFCAFARKRQLIEIFEKTFENFEKIS